MKTSRWVVEHTLAPFVGIDAHASSREQSGRPSGGAWSRRGGGGAGGEKRARISEASSPSPRTEGSQEQKSPTCSPPPSTPPPPSPSDHDLNVEEELEEHEPSLTPENLSMKERDDVKREDDKWESPDLKYKYRQRSAAENVAEEPAPLHKSPVDVLMKVFPRRGRHEIEAILARCKGDVVAAMEAMVNGQDGAYTSPDSPYLQYQSKSAFSPLTHQSFKFSPSRRFLTPPYSGTGYLPTVIRPPPDYLPPFLPPAEMMYGRQMQLPSPGTSPTSPTSPTSDNTNNEGFSD
ncbi:unnamed protein product, partial [Iphiclides podalirius]